MLEKIKKLLESTNGDDQLIGLSLGLANNVDFREILEDNDDSNDGGYMSNETDLEGLIEMGDYCILLGWETIRTIPSNKTRTFTSLMHYSLIKKEFFNPKIDSE